MAFFSARSIKYKVMRGRSGFGRGFFFRQVAYKPLRKMGVPKTFLRTIMLPVLPVSFMRLFLVKANILTVEIFNLLYILLQSMKSRGQKRLASKTKTRKTEDLKI